MFFSAFRTAARNLLQDLKLLLPPSGDDLPLGVRLLAHLSKDTRWSGTDVDSGSGDRTFQVT